VKGGEIIVEIPQPDPLIFSQAHAPAFEANLFADLTQAESTVTSAKQWSTPGRSTVFDDVVLVHLVTEL
jgi:hypothetical protein